MESASKKILCIGGIQHDVKDFESVRSAVQDYAELTVVERIKDHGGIRNAEGWDRKLLEYYLEQATMQEYQGIVGHSRGCHFVLNILKEMQFKFALLLNPPLRKHADFTVIPAIPERPKFSDAVTEEKLQSLVWDMHSEMFESFMKRHAAHEVEHGRPHPSFFWELKNVVRKDALASQIATYSGSTPLHVVQSLQDPWAMAMQSQDNVQMHYIENTGHYSHMTKAHEIDGIIREIISVRLSRPDSAIVERTL